LYLSVPLLDFALGVATTRNVASYMSHNPALNVFDHSIVMYPHLMLLSMENIPPMRDSSLDNGVVGNINDKIHWLHRYM